MDAARTRIGRIKMKGGAEVRLLRPPVMDEGRSRFRRALDVALNELDPEQRVSGFAVVVWTDTNYSIDRVWCGPGSRIPRLLAPDFVRNLLMSSAVEDYAEERIMQNLGYEPDSAS